MPICLIRLIANYMVYRRLLKNLEKDKKRYGKPKDFKLCSPNNISRRQAIIERLSKMVEANETTAGKRGHDEEDDGDDEDMGSGSDDGDEPNRNGNEIADAESQGSGGP